MGERSLNGVTQSVHVSKYIVRPPLRHWRNRDCHEFRFDEWFSHTFSRRLERANPFMRERKDNNFLRATGVPRRKTHDDKLFFSGYVMARCTVCYSTEIKSDLGCALQVASAWVSRQSRRPLEQTELLGWCTNNGCFGIDRCIFFY